MPATAECAALVVHGTLKPTDLYKPYLANSLTDWNHAKMLRSHQQTSFTILA